MKLREFHINSTKELAEVVLHDTHVCEKTVKLLWCISVNLIYMSVLSGYVFISTLKLESRIYSSSDPKLFQG